MHSGKQLRAATALWSFVGTEAARSAGRRLTFTTGDSAGNAFASVTPPSLFYSAIPERIPMGGETAAFFAFGLAMLLSGLITGALWREVARKISRTHFVRGVRAGFNHSRRAFDDCEGCYARPAVRYTDDDVHLCQRCYDEVPKTK